MKSKVYIVDILSNNNYGKCTGHYIPVAKNYLSLLYPGSDVTISAGRIYGDSFMENQMLWLPYSISSKPGLWNNIKGKIQSLINCYYFFQHADENSIVIWQQSTAVTSCVGLWLLCRRRDLRIYMIQYSQTALNSKLKRFIYDRAKSKITGFICPNDSVGKAYKLPYCVVPDYIYTGDNECDKAISFEDRRYDFCIVGRFNKDKGVVETIERLKDSRYKVIVAGRPDSEVYGNLIKEAVDNCSNIELHLGFIESDDYNNYIRNSKYCILNYQGEYSIRSSGVVYDIIFNGVPVIGSRCSALQFVEDNEIGHLYESLNDIQIENLMNTKQYEIFMQKISIYRNFHKNYIKKIQDFLGL